MMDLVGKIWKGREAAQLAVLFHANPGIGILSLVSTRSEDDGSHKLTHNLIAILPDF